MTVRPLCSLADTCDELTAASDEGTTQRLSKIWMPLEEWTKLTMDGLLSMDGSGAVAVGSIKKFYDDFEAGKTSLVL